MELESVDLEFEVGALGAFSDDLKGDGNLVIAEDGDGVEEDGKAFEIDKPADTDEAQGEGAVES